MEHFLSRSDPNSMRPIEVELAERSSLSDCCGGCSSAGRGSDGVYSSSAFFSSSSGFESEGMSCGKPSDGGTGLERMSRKLVLPAAGIASSKVVSLLATIQPRISSSFACARCSGELAIKRPLCEIQTVVLPSCPTTLATPRQWLGPGVWSLWS